MEMPTPDVLTGLRVQLRPLTAADGPALAAAVADGRLWELPFTVVPSPATADAYVRGAMDAQAAGTAVPFTIRVRATDAVVGSTRFWRIDRPNRTLEIGHTWVSAGWQRTFVNTEAKLLLLTLAFERLGCLRVQFMTDVRNAASRAAILRLGAVQEGVLRRDRIMPDGHRRDTVVFSIIDDEWPAVRERLRTRLAAASDRPG